MASTAAVPEPVRSDRLVIAGELRVHAGERGVDLLHQARELGLAVAPVAARQRGRAPGR